VEEVEAGIPGTWRNRRAQERPVVGDYVWVKDAGGTYRVTEVGERRTVLQRRLPGPVPVAQVMAANIERVWILTSMQEEPRLSWLERAASMVWDGGAEPVVIGTKLDLSPDPAAFEWACREHLPGMEFYALSALEGVGIDVLRATLGPRETVVLLGKSGAGKSTLVNALHPPAGQRVEAVRGDDGRGRHTTAHRQLFRLASGELIIDIPGIREMERWDGGASSVFQDIDEFALACRFTDCRHESEPGCAVRAAVQDGCITEEHFQSHRKMERERQFQERKESPAARATYAASHKVFARAIRQRAALSPKERQSR
jgi:ribosome biogenesis GTPase